MKQELEGRRWLISLANELEELDEYYRKLTR
jgi:hypothetical protein